MTEVGQSWPPRTALKFVYLSDVAEELAADFLTPMLTREWLRWKEDVSLTDAAE